MVISRRGLLGLTAGAGLAALAGCAAGNGTTGAATTAGTSAGTSVTIGLTYIPNIQFAPFYVAETNGLYKDTGAQVTLRHHGAQEGLFTALAAGQEHVVVAGADEMLQARAEGMDLVAIAQYYRQYPVVAIVTDASPVKTAADLKGRTIGVPGRYGETWFGLLVLLKSAGLTEADVKITEIGYTQQAALTSHKVDAVMGFSNNDVVNFTSAGVPVRALPLAAGTVPLVGISLVSTQKFLDANGALAKKIVDAMTAGFAATLKDQAAAVTTSGNYVTTLKSDAAAQAAAAKTLAATAKLWTDASGAINPALDAAQFAAMATFMKDQGLLKAAVDPAKAMSNSYHS